MNHGTYLHQPSIEKPPFKGMEKNKIIKGLIRNNEIFIKAN